MRVLDQPHSLIRASNSHVPGGCFFVDIAVLAVTIVVPCTGGTWRNDISQRLEQLPLPEGLRQELVGGDWRLHGRTIGEFDDIAAFVDRTLRLSYAGLLGGMPPKQKKYHQMTNEEFRELAYRTP